MLEHAVIDSLFAADLPDTDHWARRYPPRQLPEGAEVTRFGPSPTGYVHIGGVYAAMISRDLAVHSGGVYLVRVEDTDQSRSVDDALSQFARAFDYFHLAADEDDEHGAYGPYRQSARAAIYHSFARELLRQGKAYLCFATKDELAQISARQEAAKVPTGYYGEWALWRDADPSAVRDRLDAGAPYVVRFRAPGEPGRVRFTDAIRGVLDLEANRNDAVILKSSDQPLRLPTYHFAHAIDDHLMRVTTVVRGDEWLSSVPLHLQLFDALGFEPVTYAHIAPLTKQVPGGKRKLSKRKDPEASVDYYIETGYPAEAVLYYLRGLANGRLAELPLEEALSAPIRLSQSGVAGPLVDLVKLEDISADYIAGLSGPAILDALRTWAAEYDREAAAVLDAERDLALRALAVEREGVDNRRKDLRKWSDFRRAYGFFFAQLFVPVTGPTDERLAPLGVPAQVTASFARDLLDGYRHGGDGGEWFGQIREAAAKNGFAASPQEYRRNPDGYVGSIREASQLVRVAITGSTRSPDLYAISQAIGETEFRRRLEPLAGADPARVST
ncbi:MAG TPA: glutamate--tRNA ligase family protein [Streptosporangiaceae bacterium]|nr:glutamate--tRNA ligase family protein [Streptosporangiaceae bacterium]